MTEIQRVIWLAKKNGIEVKFSEGKEDLEKVGVHIVEPSINALLDAVSDAVRDDLKLVIIHRLKSSVE